MIKKSILIENKASIKSKYNQLVIKTEAKQKSIPIEEIGFLIIDNREVYISITAINQLVDNNAAVIICNPKHLPNGMFLNLNSHHIQQEIFRKQINASEPLKKNLWKQTVKEKIQNQGVLLENITAKKNNFTFIAQKVKSGDSTNMEAVAASLYWRSFYNTNFKRERYGPYPNNFLNYGYAILRGATARALSGSGLLNTLGIHHRNKYNAYALADDIMEPFRPLVDKKVYELIQHSKEQELTSAIKQQLIQLTTQTVYFKKIKSPLMIALQKTASSLQQCFTGERKKINYPTLWNSINTE